MRIVLGREAGMRGQVLHQLLDHWHCLGNFGADLSFYKRDTLLLNKKQGQKPIGDRCGSFLA